MMKKRIVAGLLWFYAFWYAGALAAQALGLPDLTGLGLGVFLGIVVAWDPMHRIWSRPARPARVKAPASTLEADPA